jgi:UDP-N-acetylglucosamine 2-epimerase (non-hydrolysing)
VTGNPIDEVIRHYDPQIRQSTVLSELGLEGGRYFLLTMHRAENVDIEQRLRGVTTAIERLQQLYNLPFIISTHPHTRDRMQAFGIGVSNNKVRFLSPFGFFDFVTLERNAFCVLSDSGTVQEECCIFRVANVTIRDVTERPETIECGSNMLSGAEPEMIVQCVRTVIPPEYIVPHVSDTVLKIVLGYRFP